MKPIRINPEWLTVINTVTDDAAVKAEYLDALGAVLNGQPIPDNVCSLVRILLTSIVADFDAVGTKTDIIGRKRSASVRKRWESVENHTNPYAKSDTNPHTKSNTNHHTKSVDNTQLNNELNANSSIQNSIQNPIQNPIQNRIQKEKENDKEKGSFPRTPFKVKEKEKEKENLLLLLPSAQARTCEGEALDELRRLVGQLDTSSIWLESVAMNNGLSVDEVRNRFPAFVNECIANGKEKHHDLGHVKQHFNSWLRIRLDIERKEKLKTQNNQAYGNYQQPNSEAARIARQTEILQRIQQKLAGG